MSVRDEPSGARRPRGAAPGLLRSAARSRRGAIGLAITSVVVLVAAVGPFLAPHSPTQIVTLPLANPSGAAPLGADLLGRDVLSRVLAGGWVILTMALVATAIGLSIGGAAGIAAGYLRGRPDGLIMRTVDVILAFPQLVFALLLVSVVGPKLWLIVLAVGLSHAPQVARVIRGATLDVSERDFVKAVEIDGVSSYRIMVREILPNLVAPFTVEAGLRLTFSIVTISALAFLGFGQQPPAPNWGLMINENRIGLTVNPWAVIAPAVLVALLTVGVNTYTDAVSRVAIGGEREPEELLLLEALTPEVVA